MATASKIIKNTTYLTSAFIGQKILSFIYFTLIARWVGAVDTGAYVFALAFSTIFSVFVDFGLGPLIQREIARAPGQTEQIVRKTLAVKTFYAIGAIIAGLLIAHLIVDELVVLQMIYIAMVLMAVDSFNLTLWSAFRGHHLLQYEGVSVILGQVIVLLVGLTGLVMGAPLTILIVALLLGSMFNAVYGFIMVKRKLGFYALPDYTSKHKKSFLKESYPFGFAGAFTRVFSSIDSVLLGMMQGGGAVGLYSVPNKIVFALQFIPSAFAASIYPAMSYHYKRDKKKMMEIFQYSVLFLFILSVPVAIGLFVLTPVIIEFVFTAEFLPAIPAMYILVWGVIFGFMEFPFGALLSAIGQQRKNTITRGVVMSVNIVLNIILIPLYSFVGAAIAALVSYALLTIMGAIWAHKYTKIDWSFLFSKFIRIFVSGVLMGGVVYYLRPTINLVFLIFIGAVAYIILIFMTRAIEFSQLKTIMKSFRRGEPKEYEENFVSNN